MVQYSNLLLVSAVAAAAPAIAAPFGGRQHTQHVEAREPEPRGGAGGHSHHLSYRETDFEHFDAREPMWGAAKNLVTNGASRKVITDPLKKTAHDAYDQHKNGQRPVGPSPAHQAMTRIKEEQKQKEHAASHDAKRAAAHAASRKKRDLEDIEEFYAREPMWGAAKNLVTNGASRKVITDPLKKTAHDAYDQHKNGQRPVGPSPAHQAMTRIKEEQKQKEHAASHDAKRAAAHAASRKKRDLEDIEEFDAREPMWSTVKNLVTNGASRKVITDPLKKTVHDAYDQHKNGPRPAGPSPAQKAWAKLKEEQKQREHASSSDAKRAAAHAASRKKRDLEDLFERDLFDIEDDLD